MKSKLEDGKLLTGAMTALVTPFDANGRIDHQALLRFVAWQVEQGIDALVPCGTTGEAAARAGRSAVLVDSNPAAVDVMQKRLAFCSASVEA